MMVEKKEKEDKKPQEERVVRPKESPKPMYDFLLLNEEVLYKNNYLILTNKRLIKHGTTKVSKLFSLFDDEFQDILYEDIVSIQKIVRVNSYYFSAAFFLLIFMALVLIVNSVPYIGGFISNFNTNPGKLALISVFLAVICLIIPFFSKIKVLKIYGKGASIEFHIFNDQDTKTIREYQERMIKK